MVPVGYLIALGHEVIDGVYTTRVSGSQYFGELPIK